MEKAQVVFLFICPPRDAITKHIPARAPARAPLPRLPTPPNPPHPTQLKAPTRVEAYPNHPPAGEGWGGVGWGWGSLWQVLERMH